MALTSTINPLCYIVQSQYRENVFNKNNMFKERLAKAKNLYRKDLLAHYGCVNAIEFSRDGEYLISGGDDKRILLWSVAGAIYDRGHPIEMRDTHSSNIFCLAFDSKNEHIYSGGNDDQVLVHEVESRKLKLIITHDKPVYSISMHPQNDNILATAGEDGRVIVFDTRAPLVNDVQIVVAEQNNGFHSVQFNPVNPKLMITANSEEGIALWDTRKPKKHLIHYDRQSGKVSGISACFDSLGKRILALRRRLPPVLYATDAENALCQFYHPQYYNSCTMKTCCFAGERDNYVLSGSDDFNLYMWKVPKDDSEWGASHLVLRGHRSIVNQVRYNTHNQFIASSGVEKMVKLWSTIPISNWKGSILKEHTGPIRTIYTHEDYVSLVGTTERINHDYSDQSMVEDPKMMAFFDSLIQREIESWDSTSDDSLTADTDSEEDRDMSKVISKMYHNGKQSGEEPKKNRSNKITQLILKKKNKLAKLAHSKSTSYVLKKFNKENLKGKKKSKQKPSHQCTKDCLKKNSKVVSIKQSKYFTRQSARNVSDQMGSSPDMPSTSTGITSSSKNVMFRVFEQDSDEEQPKVTVQIEEDVNEDNLVNILPTPLNGSRDLFINVLEIDIATLRNSRNEPQSYTRTSDFEEDDEDDDTKSDHNGTVSSDSDVEVTHVTPAKRRRTNAVSGDSGCATGSSSGYSRRSRSSSSRASRNDNQSCSKERDTGEECRYSKRLKKMRAVKRKIAVDSDSN